MADDNEHVPLKKIQQRLRRSMETLDGGFAYERVYGDGGESRLWANAVRVRVELQTNTDDGGKTLSFRVNVDYTLPQGATAQQAYLYAQCAKQGARKAAWAESIVEGLSWPVDEVLGAAKGS